MIEIKRLRILIYHELKIQIQSKSDKLKHGTAKEEETEKKSLPKHEIIRRLRDRGEPIRLFGETDADVRKRLNLIETSEPKELGMRNDFREAMEKSEQECLNEIMNTVNGENYEASTEVDVKDDAIDFNEILVRFPILFSHNFALLLNYMIFLRN